MNRLQQETSPYLLQHRENPVCWYPWGEEAFRTAREENKPIFLSVGYSTCYWCHVMEKDSFERSEVAEVLNRSFVSIKVDREERPDVDQIYMDAVVGLSGRGGWPMSVFLTHELKPFWAGTFFYRDQFIQILDQLSRAWRERRAEIEESSEEISSTLGVMPDPVDADLSEVVQHAANALLSNFDPEFGGFGAAPKFPPAMQVRFLLREAARTGDQALSHMALHSLERMCCGGIYDHLAGGFARYSTDQRWLVPHFEKMLYDNALLASAYLDAFRATGEGWCLEVAEETLDFLLSEFQSPGGAFFSALDAGEVDREGEYYVWRMDELEGKLSEAELALAKKYFGVVREGNFEESNVLFLPSGWESRKARGVHKLRKKLLQLRSARVRPHLDDKILTAWNGFALSAFSLAYQITGEDRYLNVAQRIGQFLRENLYSAGELLRSFAGGVARHSGCLDDYAAFIEGLLALYESDFNLEWLHLSNELQQIQDRLFWDNEVGGYFHSAAPEVYLRKKDLIDNATPSGNSVSFNNLLKLAQYTGDTSLYEKATKIWKCCGSLLQRHPAAFSAMLCGASEKLSGFRQLVVVAQQGDAEVHEILREIRRDSLLPVIFGCIHEGVDENRLTLLFRGKQGQGKTPAYFLCEEGVCREPVHSSERLRSLLSAKK